MEAISITLPPELLKWAREESGENGQSVSSLIAVLLKQAKDKSAKRKR